MRALDQAFGGAGVTPDVLFDRPGATPAERVYRALAGCWPDDAVVETDEAFDTHAFASIIAVAASDGDVRDRVGLGADEFHLLLASRFPNAMALFDGDCGVDRSDDADEIALVRDLLLGSRTSDTRESRWLACLIARRAVEPNHLWEDLGLRNRGELSRLLLRHFAPLARRNTRNMRWKRFFYRMMCESDGFVLCTTPVCTMCGDFALCFGEETGESRLARNRLANGTATTLS